MRIQFVRSGGFAGMRLAATIDSSNLPAEEVQALKNELQTANFFNLPARLTGSSGGADRFQYEITVEDGGKKHTIETGESSMPDSLQPFVQHVEALARTSRG